MLTDLLMFFSIRVIIFGIFEYLILGLLFSKKCEKFKQFKILGIIITLIGILILISSFFAEMVDGMFIIFCVCIFIIINFLYFIIVFIKNISKFF